MEAPKGQSDCRHSGKMTYCGISFGASVPGATCAFSQVYRCAQCGCEIRLDELTERS
jgi:hypothetical protein